MNLRAKPPSEAHLQFRNELIDVMKKHGAKLDGTELLAVAAYLVGQLIAVQDQRKITPEIALSIVTANIEAGNAEAIESSLMGPMGRT